MDDHLSGPIRFEIYDVAGRLVRRLLTRNGYKGYGWVVWDGRDDAGVRVGQGIYFGRLSTTGRAVGQRIVAIE
jgi:flagellar hook assembly protein FlgD